MSEPVNETKARLLLEELNRRNRWFSILRGNRGSSPWAALVPGFCGLFAAVSIWWFFDSGQVTAILMLVMALSGFMGIYADGVHRRVDALIQLLQQEGMLQSTLPASREEPPAEGGPGSPPDKA